MHGLRIYIYIYIKLGILSVDDQFLSVYPIKITGNNNFLLICIVIFNLIPNVLDNSLSDLFLLMLINFLLNFLRFDFTR